MFQFPALPPPSRVVTGLQPAGLPHSDISGSIPVCGSPELFAAYHVLHRHRKPRHPPFALVLFLVNHLRLHSLKCICLWNCSPLMQLEKTRILLSDLISFLLLYLFVSLSIVKDHCPFGKPFFRNGLQRYALFRNLQTFFAFFSYFRTLWAKK